MLRWAVIMLVAANALFYAWSHGWLGAVDEPGAAEREPDRLKRQVRPEAIRVLPATPAASAPAASAAALSPVSSSRSDLASPSTAAEATAGAADGADAAGAVPMPATALLADASASAAAPACLEAGPFADAQWAQAEQALRDAGVPADRWTLLQVDRAGVWLVYMGRYADRETLQRKEAELQRLHVGYDVLRGPAGDTLAPGLSLGRFSDRASADAALERLGQRGVRTARVIALSAPTQQRLLRVPKADAALAGRLQGAARGSAAFGTGFKACVST